MLLATRRRSTICIFCASKLARSASSATNPRQRDDFVIPHLPKNPNTPEKVYSFGEISDKRSRHRRPRRLQPFRFRDKSVYNSEDRKVYGSNERNNPRFGPLPAVRHLKIKEEDPEKVLTKALGFLEEKLALDDWFISLNLEHDMLNLKFRDFKKRTILDVGKDTEAETWITKKIKEKCSSETLEQLQHELRYAFYGELVLSRAFKESQGKLSHYADLRYPPEWFYPARRMKRVIHLHVGPTNSGKTYQALQRLQNARTGLYAGPLRLLAHEVYMRLNALGKSCRLVTGDERRDVPIAPEGDGSTTHEPVTPLLSSTVEMVPTTEEFDVAVIDEIQMIGSEDRGFAWTDAVLGVQARELHLCGEERAVPLIQELAVMCGDELILHRYERLNPLEMEETSLQGNLRNLQKGDCIVAFSVVMIHGLRKVIEETLKKKVAIIYGGLPPETRAHQARLFNDPNNDYDILVASNAVGMGLNLNIKRMIFQSSVRNDGRKLDVIPTAEVKQIAGRAGRFSTAQDDMDKRSPGADVTVCPDPPKKQLGLVTTLEPYDYHAIAKALSGDPEPIKAAGILPPYISVVRFAKFFPPGTPFSHVIIRLCELVKMNRRFFMCDIKSIISISDSIDQVKDLDLYSKWTFCSAPIEPRKPGEIGVALECAEAVAKGKSISIVDMESVQIELLEDDVAAPDRRYLRSLEQLHKALIVFMWLSFRFPRIFVQEHLAEHVKRLTEKRIAEVLSLLSVDYDQLRRKRQQALESMLPRDREDDKSGDATPLLHSILPPEDSQKNQGDEADTTFGLSREREASDSTVQRPTASLSTT